MLAAPVIEKLNVVEILKLLLLVILVFLAVITPHRRSLFHSRFHMSFDLLQFYDWIYIQTNHFCLLCDI